MLKKLLPYMKKYRKEAVLSPIMMVLEVFADILIPMLMADIVNIGIQNRDSAFVVKTSLLMAGLAVFGALNGTVSARLGSRAGYGTATELRKKLYRSIQKYSFSNIDKMSVASLITRLTADSETVGMVTMMSLRMAFRAPFMLVFALIAAFRIDSGLALIFAVALPLAVLCLLIIFKKAVPYFKAIRLKIDGLNSVVGEQLSGIRVIKSFNREEFSEAVFDEKNSDFRDTMIRATRIVQKLNPLLTLMIYSCMIAVLWFGGSGVMEGRMLPGTIIAFLTYVTQISIAVLLISMLAVSFVNGSAALSRIFEAIETESEIKQSETPLSEVPDGSIDFLSASFRYPGYKDFILENINLHIHSGEHIGIIGSTGSSKSTLVQMIPRLYDLESGHVLVGGNDVKDYSPEALRSGIGFVMQNNILVSGTVRSNLLWGKKDAKDEELVTALKSAAAYDFVFEKKGGLDSKVEQGGANFSGGQKQRLCIARALLQNPKILILDDSTSAVDMETDARIRKVIRDEFKGVTTLIISQRVDSIKNSDKIIVMNDGRVEAFGKHDELMENSETYREIALSQEMGIGK